MMPAAYLTNGGTNLMKAPAREKSTFSYSEENLAIAI
jgi:hypothetical protein